MFDNNFWSSDTVWFYISLLLAGILIFQIGQWYGQTQTQQPENSDTNSVQQTKNSPQKHNQETESPLASVPDWIREIPTDSQKKALGNPDAPVTVVEYLDMQCPFCQRYTRNTFPKIRTNYIATGKVYYKIKHLPLPMHENAVPAANAAECAADQDTFWAFKYVVMNSDRSLTDSTFVEIANHIGIDDMTSFKDCVTSMKHEDVVVQEKKEGQQKGASATPTIFVEDTKIEGAQPYSRFKELIEKKL